VGVKINAQYPRLARFSKKDSFHVVKPGESLRGIIEAHYPHLHFSRFELTVLTEMLAGLNNKKNHRIKPGEVINLFPFKVEELVDTLKHNRGYPAFGGPYN